MHVLNFMKTCSISYKDLFFHFKFCYIICSHKYPYLFPALLKRCIWLGSECLIPGELIRQQAAATVVDSDRVKFWMGPSSETAWGTWSRRCDILGKSWLQKRESGPWGKISPDFVVPTSCPGSPRAERAKSF